MKIHSHKVSITDDEVEILGEALCADIKNTIKAYSVLNDMEHSREMVECELELLHSLTNAGYKMFVDAGDMNDSYFTSDTEVWFEGVYNKVTSSI